MKTSAHTRPGSRRGLILIMLAALLWGTVGVATGVIYTLSETNALSIGFFRLALATPALLLACWRVCGGGMFRVGRRDLALMLLIGAATALYQVSLFSAIRLIGVSLAVMVTLCTAPVLVAIASVWLFRERITAWTVLALLFAITGTVLLVGGNPDLAGMTGVTTGVVLALGAALGYGAIALCGRALAGRYHPLQPITIGFGAGALLLLPFALANGLVVEYSLQGWLLLLHLGLVPTALGYVLFLFGMRYTTATVASIVTLLEPLTATALAWLLFGERLGLIGLVGGALLFGAILLLYRGELRRPEAAPAYSKEQYS